jgi:hypothetical protein
LAARAGLATGENLPLSSKYHSRLKRVSSRYAITICTIEHLKFYRNHEKPIANAACRVLDSERYASHRRNARSGSPPVGGNA